MDYRVDPPSLLKQHAKMEIKDMNTLVRAMANAEPTQDGLKAGLTSRTTLTFDIKAFNSGRIHIWNYKPDEVDGVFGHGHKLWFNADDLETTASGWLTMIKVVYSSIIPFDDVVKALRMDCYLVEEKYLTDEQNTEALNYDGAIMQNNERQQFLLLTFVSMGKKITDAAYNNYMSKRIISVKEMVDIELNLDHFSIAGMEKMTKFFSLSSNTRKFFFYEVAKMKVNKMIPNTIRITADVIFKLWSGAHMTHIVHIINELFDKRPEILHYPHIESEVRVMAKFIKSIINYGKYVPYLRLASDNDVTSAVTTKSLPCLSRLAYKFAMDSSSTMANYVSSSLTPAQENIVEQLYDTYTKTILPPILKREVEVETIVPEEEKEEKKSE